MQETDIYELKKPVIIEVSKKHIVSTPVQNRLKSPEKISTLIANLTEKRNLRSSNQKKLVTPQKPKSKFEFLGLKRSHVQTRSRSSNKKREAKQYDLENPTIRKLFNDTEKLKEDKRKRDVKAKEK